MLRPILYTKITSTLNTSARMSLSVSEILSHSKNSQSHVLDKLLLVFKQCYPPPPPHLDQMGSTTEIFLYNVIQRLIMLTSG